MIMQRYEAENTFLVPYLSAWYFSQDLSSMMQR